jgi:hypothetical protein
VPKKADARLVWGVVGLAAVFVVVVWAALSLDSVIKAVVTGLIALVAVGAVIAMLWRSGSRGTWRFADTNAAKDADKVLAILRDEPTVNDPPSKEDVRKLSARWVRAGREREVVRLSLELWRRHDRLDGRDLNTEAQQRRDDQEMSAFWPPDDPRRRTAAGFWSLTQRLRAANDELKTLQRGHWPRDPQSESRFQAAVDRVGAFGLWFAEDAWRFVSRRVIGLVHAILRFLASLSYRIVGFARGWFAVAEAVSLLLTLSVPVLVYVLTLYTDTWGSPLDVLTAFAAGFAGKIALDFGTSLAIPQLPSKTTTGDETEPTDGSETNGKPDLPAPTQTVA